jgi:serine phosphatase RsbU (regulator of sigma subunit)
MNLRTRFALSMTAALAVVMAIAGFLLVGGVTELARQETELRIAESVKLTAVERWPENYEQQGGQGTSVGEEGVVRIPVVYGLKRGLRKKAEIYQGRGDTERKIEHLMVAPEKDGAGKEMLKLILGISLMVLVAGALVAVWIAGQVAAPLEGLVDGVRQISHGNFAHRTRVKGGGAEVSLLAKTIDRMAVSLQEAQEAELEYSAAEREMEVAAEVHEALLPQATPEVEGYEVGALQIGCPTPGGDFFDFLQLPGGRIGFLLCEVSGKGVPGALVAATARSYLRSVLGQDGDIADGLRKINRYLARDVRRGMYVTAMYALLDPESGIVEVACAGHKVPLLRYSAADGKIRTVQPEGIALGFDSGPIFDRALQTVDVPLEPGDRLLLANTGPIVVLDPDGQELGERDFYRDVLRRSRQGTDAMLEGLEEDFEEFADEEPYPNDITILTVRRTT